MKIKFLGLLLFVMVQLTIAQKKPLDLAAIDSWPNIEKGKISNDGKYIVYNISSKKDGTKLVLQSIGNIWKMEVKGAADAVITEDSKRVIFKTGGDSLGIAVLGEESMNLIDKINSFKVSSIGNREWLAYQKNDQSDSLIVLNLVSGQQKRYSNVREYEFSDNGKTLLIQEVHDKNSTVASSLILVNLINGDSHCIWQGSQASNLTMDSSGLQIAFLTEHTISGEKVNQICYYKSGMESAEELINDGTSGMKGTMLSHFSEIYFSPDGENMFFYIREIDNKRMEDSLKNHPRIPIVWSYKDKTLADTSGKNIEYFQAVVNLQNQTHVVRIEWKEGERIRRSCYSKNQVLLITNEIGDALEHAWRSSARPNLYMVSTIDGKRTLLAEDCMPMGWRTIGFSPTGNYTFWFNEINGNWYTYNVRTGIVKNICTRVPVPMHRDVKEEGGDIRFPEGLVGWIKDDAALMVYDKYDIWQLDPAGLKAPRNITLGYGRKNRIRLRYLDLNEIEGEYPTFEPEGGLLLYTVNEASKTNGFAEIFLNRNQIPTILRQGQMDYYGVMGGSGFAGEPSDDFVLKAKDANAYIFRPHRDSLFANLSFTNDLIHFQQLTDFEPQKEYNWFRSELVHWKQPDGLENDGILYKPEDFDARKKYPLVVYIYETFSESLNRSFTPVLSIGTLEIPWFISRGYLVFVPDIHYVPGHPGRSAYNSVISGITLLSGKPWVDTRRLGLQGHSFGGYEVNYIVTRTKVFAAACSASGVSDWIGFLGRISDHSGSHTFIEMSQPRMGVNLWQRPDLYIGESPIFKADNVNTPLLIVANPLDQSVDQSQGIEWFTSLRRLGKKAWMLQYTNEGHVIWKEENQLDFSTKMSQFFDHFLKDAPEPGWMKGEN